MGNCQRFQSRKTLKNPLDKREGKCYNMQAVSEERPNGANRVESPEKITKKVEKTFEKPLDKTKEM